VTLQDAKMLLKGEITFGRVWFENVTFLYQSKENEGNLIREFNGKTVMKQKTT